MGLWGITIDRHGNKFNFVSRFKIKDSVVGEKRKTLLAKGLG